MTLAKSSAVKKCWPIWQQNERPRGGEEKKGNERKGRESKKRKGEERRGEGDPGHPFARGDGLIHHQPPWPHFCPEMAVN